MADVQPTRRERLRAETVDEIRTRALALLDEQGAQSLALATVAREMGLSAPALYRYFPSRDALLADVVLLGYRDLAEACRRAGASSRRRTPARHLAAVLEAYRGWALAHPRRYAVLFGERPGEVADDDAAIAAVHEGMLALLVALARVRGDGTGATAPDAGGRLGAQLRAWAASRGGAEVDDVDVMRLGVLTWTRVHGLVGLELAGALGAMGLDPLLLLRAEVEDAVRLLTPGD